MALHFDKTVEKTEFELIPEGEYEVVLNAEWKQTRAGEQFINCTFKIRKDVEQDQGGRLIFDGIYKNKQTGEFQSSKINGILAAIPFAKQDFEDYDELIQYINDQTMRVEVEIQKGDAGYKDKNTIKYLSYKPSEIKQELVEDTAPADLPF